MDSPAHDVPVVMSSWLRFPVPKVGSLREGHGICPSCNARRMVETAAHLVDNVFLPRVGALGEAPVRQWVLSLPKRLRYFLYHNPKVASKVLRIFFDEIRKQLIQHYHPASNNLVKIGGVSFIHRFGSSLNAHPHLPTEQAFA